MVRALFTQGRALGDLGRTDEAVEAYGQVVDRFGEDSDPALREAVTIACSLRDALGAAMGPQRQNETTQRARAESCSRSDLSALGRKRRVPGRAITSGRRASLVASSDPPGSQRAW